MTIISSKIFLSLLMMLILELDLQSFVSSQDGLIGEDDSMFLPFSEGNNDQNVIEGSGGDSTTTATSTSTLARLDISITLKSVSEDQRDEFEADVLNGLKNYYRGKIAKGRQFNSIVLHNIVYTTVLNSTGHVRGMTTVNYTVLLEDTEDAKGEFAKAHGDLITSEHFMALGEMQTVVETTISGATYQRNTGSGVSKLQEISCDIFEKSINGCPSGTECEVDVIDDTTRCVVSSSMTTSSTGSSPGLAKLDISITLESVSEDQRDEFEADVSNGLENYYRGKMAKGRQFRSIVIHNITYTDVVNSAGQVRSMATVNYTVVLEDTDEAKGEFAKAHGDLITTEQFMALGAMQTVLETTISGATYKRNSRSVVSGLKEISCEIFEKSIKGCPIGTECDVDIADDTTRCVHRKAKVSDNWPLTLGLSIGLPLFALVCAAICCCCWFICLAKRRRRKPLPRDDDSSVESVFVLNMIPVRFNTIGRSFPLYGAYFMEPAEQGERWPSPESISDPVEDDQFSYDSEDNEGNFATRRSSWFHAKL